MAVLKGNDRTLEKGVRHQAFGGLMKMSHRLQSQTPGPAWGLAFGLFLTSVGAGLWFYAKATQGPKFDESVGVAALLIGLFSVVYAARKIHHKKRGKAL